MRQEILLDARSVMEAEPLAPNGVPVANSSHLDSNVTRTLDQAALEDVASQRQLVRRSSVLLPFIFGFAAAWIARQFKVI
jgi:hypothetical protein